METRMQAITAHRVRDDSLLGATASPITPKPQTPKTPYYWVRVVNNKDSDCLILKGYCTAIIVGSRPDRKPLPEAALYILGAVEGNEMLSPWCPVGLFLLPTGLRKGQLVGRRRGNMVGRASRLTIAQLASTSDTAYLWTVAAGWGVKRRRDTWKRSISNHGGRPSVPACIATDCAGALDTGVSKF